MRMDPPPSLTTLRAFLGFCKRLRDYRLGTGALVLHAGRATTTQCDTRHRGLLASVATGPSSMPTSRMIIWRVSRAGRLAGGLGGAMTVTWRSRGRVTPSDSRTQRHGWAASGNSASRVTLSSNGTTTSHRLHKLEIVVIVDSRVLDLFVLFLTSFVVGRNDQMSVAGGAVVGGV